MGQARGDTGLAHPGEGGKKDWQWTWAVYRVSLKHRG
jgi:hypothetical protein